MVFHKDFSGFPDFFVCFTGEVLCVKISLTDIVRHILYEKEVSHGQICKDEGRISYIHSFICQSSAPECSGAFFVLQWGMCQIFVLQSDGRGIIIKTRILLSIYEAQSKR